MLGTTHMIDDRLDVHRALRGLVPHLYLYGHGANPRQSGYPHPYLARCRSRAHAMSAVTAPAPRGEIRGAAVYSRPR
ncbi:hypothetical protein [Nocardia jiangsuensis]|uniref:Uncharacterized protein n=1 Tax=Nocardia jiangsuensis TaxID=1691563 RepID=A0ABV8DNA0_9NOCA